VLFAHDSFILITFLVPCLFWPFHRVAGRDVREEIDSSPPVFSVSLRAAHAIVCSLLLVRERAFPDAFPFLAFLTNSPPPLAIRFKPADHNVRWASLPPPVQPHFWRFFSSLLACLVSLPGSIFCLPVRCQRAHIADLPDPERWSSSLLRRSQWPTQFFSNPCFFFSEAKTPLLPLERPCKHGNIASL